MEALVAHYCLHKLKKFPHEYLDIPIKERAFIIASICTVIDEEKKAERELKKSRGKKR